MKYKAVPGVIVTSACDSYYLVTAEMKILINETAAYYWEKLKGGTDEEELAAWAKERYDIEDEQALLCGIRELIDSMLEKHLIMRCGI